MYAIIATGGKQYKVAEGDIINVEKLGVEAGENVTFDQVLAVNDGSLKVGQPTVAGATVTASVVKEGKAKIVIGARSAIFAPLNNIGIIIIDEEHDSSYKSESVPKYDAKEIAKKIAKENNCPLVLGSATPDLTTYYKAQQGEITLLALTKRANNSKLPSVDVVDLKMELANGNRSMLSYKLHDAIQKNLEKKRQTILFLNRRGYSTFIMCRECGYTVKCKNCDISLTYHRFENKLKCHYCLSLIHI